MEVNKILTLLGLMFVCTAVSANTPAGGLPKAQVDLHDEAALQRGAKLFVNYCLSCHSAAYMRYSRLARDLHIPEKVVTENLMFTGDKIGSTMEVAMRPADAEHWLGMSPPDLSTIARSRGADWIYGYLTSFYLDPKRPTGVNNLVFKDTSMPHVLWELQGWQQRVASADVKPQAALALELKTPGKMNEQDYRHAVNDLVSFLVYLAEPVQLERQRLGGWVLGFLAILTGVLYLLKKEYWKAVH
jgi:ubiquinol-cytochrome c reductase cytochrome c1 subunit